MCDGSDDRLCARVDMDVFDNKPLIRGGMTAGLRPLAARERLITLQLKPPQGGRSWSFVGAGRPRPFVRGTEVAEVLDIIG